MPYLELHDPHVLDITQRRSLCIAGMNLANAQVHSFLTAARVFTRYIHAIEPLLFPSCHIYKQEISNQTIYSL